MNSHTIPPDRLRIDRSFEVITDRNLAVMTNIATNASSGLANVYYSACMNTNQIESDGAAPVYGIWSSLRPMTTNYDNLGVNLAVLFKSGMSGLYELLVEVDASEPTQNIYSLHQGGLTLPDASYYFDASIYAQYINHIAQMFQLAGANPQDALAVAAFEKALANVTVSPADLYSPFVTFNKMQWSTLALFVPQARFSDLIASLNIRTEVGVTVDAPAYFSEMGQVLSQTPPSVVFNYLKWRALHWFAPRLSSVFFTADFAFFGGVLSGRSLPPPRTKMCVQAVEAALPELIGRLFAQEAFPQSSKDSVTSIFQDIVSAFKANSHKLSWMDPVTRQKAIDKIENIITYVGIPDHPRNYSTFGPQFGSHYAKNLLITTQDAFSRAMASAGQPTDRSVFLIPPTLVNAYFDEFRNTIVRILVGIAYPGGLFHTLSKKKTP